METACRFQLDLQYSASFFSDFLWLFGLTCVRTHWSNWELAESRIFFLSLTFIHSLLLCTSVGLAKAHNTCRIITPLNLALSFKNIISTVCSGLSAVLTAGFPPSLYRTGFPSSPIFRTVLSPVTCVSQSDLKSCIWKSCMSHEEIYLQHLELGILIGWYCHTGAPPYRFLSSFRLIPITFGIVC